eukprot:1157790-Pelagomonas_calceolata.AAC.10
MTVHHVTQKPVLNCINKASSQSITSHYHWPSAPNERTCAHLHTALLQVFEDAASYVVPQQRQPRAGAAAISIASTAFADGECV